MERVKIVLDADVLIHFSKADKLSLLPEILPEYDHVVLSVVYDEVKSIRNQLDNQIFHLRNIKVEEFLPTLTSWGKSVMVLRFCHKQTPQPSWKIAGFARLNLT